jgi:hypothetical protein
MNAIRKDSLPDSTLEALKPAPAMLADESIVIETNLTDEERKVIANGEEEYKQGGYVSLKDVNWY